MKKWKAVTTLAIFAAITLTACAGERKRSRARSQVSRVKRRGKRPQKKVGKNFLPALYGIAGRSAFYRPDMERI